MAHGAGFTLLSFLAVYLSANFELEKSKTAAVVFVRSLFGDKPDYTRQFTFIDVSASKTLVSRADGSGNLPVTDRDALGQLFKAISQGEQTHKLILCDLLFDHETTSDADLGRSMSTVDRLILPSSGKEPAALIPFLKEIITGDPGYRVSSGLYTYDGFFKYQYVSQSGLKTLPLKMFELSRRQTSSYHSGTGLVFLDNKTFANHTILNSRITLQDLSDQEGGTRLVPLNELLALLKVNRKFFYDQYFRAKYVIIGDFENDMHATFLGEMPGSLILTNLFLGLVYGDSQITFAWLSYLFVAFSILAALVIYPFEWMHRMHARLSKTAIGAFLPEAFLIVLLVWLIAFFSFYIFQKYTDVLLISFYLIIIQSKSLKILFEKHVKPVADH